LQRVLGNNSLKITVQPTPNRK